MHLYVLTNTVNGKRYVGQTVGSVAQRIACHKRSQQPIGHAIRKYGWDKFSVQSCEVESTELLNELEEFAIVVAESRYTHHGYNIKRGGDNQTGQVISEATKKKLSRALKGRKRPPEVVAKVAAANRGKKRSPEWVENHRKALIGRKHTKGHRAKISASNIGRVVSEETRAKISAANSGLKRAPDVVERMRQGLIGKKASDETRAKMSASHRGKKMPPRTPEQLAHMSAAAKGKPWSAARRAAHERKYA